MNDDDFTPEEIDYLARSFIAASHHTMEYEEAVEEALRVLREARNLVKGIRVDALEVDEAEEKNWDI